MNSVVSVAIVGDLLPMVPLPESGAVAQTLAKLSEADVAFGNLEAAVSRRGVPVEKLINLRIDPDRLLGNPRGWWAGFLRDLAGATG